MTPQPDITDSELIEALAIEVMGWEKYDSSGANEPWNPLTDWNHWRQVEEKIMKDPAQWKSFMKALESNGAIWECHEQWSYSRLYASCDLRTRAIALLTAIDSLKSHD